jgi:hypothetical protein
MPVPAVLRSFYPVLIVFCMCLTSCSGLVTSSVIQPAIGNLQQQTDIDLVCEGAPAYLLMIDSMLISSPEDKGLLLIATQSYSAYATALEVCDEAETDRIAKIASKAHLYGLRLLHHYLPVNQRYDDQAMALQLNKLNKSDVPDVFWGTFGWLTWVKSQQGSPSSIADIVTIEKIMTRLLELDETYQGGSIHLFFGGYHAAKPKMFGGRPDLSKQHFEKALALSGRKFLLTQTTYAETLARTTMDQELHDRLIKEVLAFPMESAPEFGLSNRIALNRAQKLLDENYFGD